MISAGIFNCSDMDGNRLLSDDSYPIMKYQLLSLENRV